MLLRMALFFLNYPVRISQKSCRATDIKPTNADRVLNNVGRVTERIDNALPSGAVYIDGKTWTARSADGEVIEPDAAVRILRMEGVKLIVQKEP